MLVKKITSKCHTLKATHNPPGKIVDLSPVLQPTQLHPASSRHSGCSKHRGGVCLLCYHQNTRLLWKLAQPAFEPLKSNTSFYMKEKNTGVCLSQKLCSNPRKPYYFMNKHTYARTHKHVYTQKRRMKRNPPPFIRRALFTAWSYPQ